jgi:hypothetical protein
MSPPENKIISLSRLGGLHHRYLLLRPKLSALRGQPLFPED